VRYCTKREQVFDGLQEKRIPSKEWMDGLAAEHTLKRGPSKPYLDALEKAGISYKTTPQIHIKVRP